MPPKRKTTDVDHDPLNAESKMSKTSASPSATEGAGWTDQDRATMISIYLRMQPPSAETVDEMAKVFEGKSKKLIKLQWQRNVSKRIQSLFSGDGEKLSSKQKKANGTTTANEDEEE